MRYTVRPISDRTWLGSMGREATRFKAKWSSTLELLSSEIEHLRGRDVVLEVDVLERHIRQDGMLRADAKATSDAVVVAFESKHGPLLYRCDRFFTHWADQGPAWQHNVRAIALTLEALRAVDRYGATETGQQYAGFKALPAGRAMPSSHMTSDEAKALLRRVVGGDYPAWSELDWHRAARRKAHPDRHAGDQSLWDQVEQAAEVLRIPR